MCNPMAFMALTAVAGGVAAKGQYDSGKYQQQVAQNNAFVQTQMAKGARETGERNEMRHRLAVAKAKSGQRAALGASGRDVNSGSALDLIGDTAMIGELDALTLRSNADLEAYQHQVGASNSIAQGRLDRLRGNYGSASTLLSTSGTVSEQWYNR